MAKIIAELEKDVRNFGSGRYGRRINRWHWQETDGSDRYWVSGGNSSYIIILRDSPERTI